MPSPIAEHLAQRFADDAQALRARATTLRATVPAGRGARPAGPSAEACLQMATACEQVSQLFGGVQEDAEVRALLPQLSGLVAGARSEPERHVFAGAVARAHEALDGGDDADEDDDEDPDDEDDA
jgi:hypothetical protein